MNWKEHLVALLTVNAIWFLMCMLVLTNMAWLPLNPDNNPSMSGDLAFNTAISFICNTNLQHYSGESGMSYLGQLILMLWHFLSAGTGIAIAAVVFIAMKEQTSEKLGNFYSFLVRSCTRLLLPIAIVVAGLLAFNGTPMTFEGKDTMVSLQGDTVQVSRGPVAAFTAIKHLGTNGGGFFGANSAHPFENPNYFTNMVEMIIQMIIPFAMIFALGFVIKKRKLAWMIFGVMTVGFALLVVPTMLSESAGNPAIDRLGISQHLGSSEGKEIRFGTPASAYWSIATTVISTGSVNSMHDSFTPIAGMNQMLGMMINAFYGGCGVGMLNFYVFMILAVFISGLMVGRTPEFLGKKIEAKEMKIAMMIALLHPFLILGSTAIASYLYTNDPTKLIEIVEIGKQLLMTRGTLTTFSIANDIAKYFAIIPALFIVAIPSLQGLNIMHLHSPESAILSAVIFNAIIIPMLIPLALKGVAYKPIGASALLRRNLFIYGLGGILVPFIGIKLIDLIVAVFI